MTLIARNVTIRSVLLLCLTLTAVLTVLFVRAITGAGGRIAIELRIVQFFAVGGTAVTVFLGFLFSALYVRLFRRSPSIPVFFVSFFFLAMTLDITKIAQIIVAFGRLPHLSTFVARASIFGHIVGVLSLFAAGLYSSGIRMQRHGTVILVGVIIAFSLSWLIPVDTSYLPDHLVYPAGIRASLEAALIVILVLAVVNFVQAAIMNQNPRQVITAAAVAAMAVGREILFYSADPVWIILGGGGVIVGATIFTGQYYRDYLVS